VTGWERNREWSPTICV